IRGRFKDAEQFDAMTRQAWHDVLLEARPHGLGLSFDRLVDANFVDQGRSLPFVSLSAAIRHVPYQCQIYSSSISHVWFIATHQVRQIARESEFASFSWNSNA